MEGRDAGTAVVPLQRLECAPFLSSTRRSNAGPVLTCVALSGIRTHFVSHQQQHHVPAMHTTLLSKKRDEIVNRVRTIPVGRCVLFGLAL